MEQLSRVALICFFSLLIQDIAFEGKKRRPRSRLEGLCAVFWGRSQGERGGCQAARATDNRPVQGMAGGTLRGKGSFQLRGSGAQTGHGSVPGAWPLRPLSNRGCHPAQHPLAAAGCGATRAWRLRPRAPQSWRAPPARAPCAPSPAPAAPGPPGPPRPPRRAGAALTGQVKPREADGVAEGGVRARAVREAGESMPSTGVTALP